MNELRELFLGELADILYAENLLLKTLPEMGETARSQPLRKAFQDHFSETETHIERLKEVFVLFQKPAKPKKCKAMEGLINESRSIMHQWEASAALDAALISATQKMEHYEIATYGCLCTWAQLLEYYEALHFLKRTLDEEKNADQKLTRLAEDFINEEARGEEQNKDLKSPSHEGIESSKP